MNLFDPKIKGNEKQYLFQCGLATFSILVVLLFLDILKHTAIIATLGATAFIIFVMPKSYISMPRQVLGGYLIGIVIGCLCHLLAHFSIIALSFVSQNFFIITFGALAVGASILLMTITDTEHPPAAAMALGLVLNQWNHQSIIFIAFAILFMVIVKSLLEPILLDLM
jgi:CBS-domain-containing membrane protein